MISMHVPTFSPFVPHLTRLQNFVLSERPRRRPPPAPLLQTIGDRPRPNSAADRRPTRDTEGFPRHHAGMTVPTDLGSATAKQ
jgi:hypothetical protein